jgi:hypothetical protein
MIDLQNVDAGNKVDLDRVLGLSLASLGVGTLIGLLWKRHHMSIMFLVCFMLSFSSIRYNYSSGARFYFFSKMSFLY